MYLICWSPDGSHILFSISAGDPRGVSLMDSSGSSSNIIIPFGVQPNWTPSGKIIFANYDTTKAQQNQVQIYISNLEGNSVRKITDLTNTLFNIQNPNISPNSEIISFIYNGEIHLVSANGKGLEQVTEGSGFAARPEWSPNGQTILFSRIIRNGPERLYYLDVATHEVTPVFPKSKYPLKDE